jgi:hypothetical protein
MITKDQAFDTDIFHDDSAVDPDSGRCVIWRRVGETATWPSKPDAFSTPVVNDAGISGAITELNALLFHAEDDCPHGYRHGRAAETTGPVIPDEDYGVAPDEVQGSLGARQEFAHRVLRKQLEEKIDEIQAGLGLTDLQMMEVVARWMQHKARNLRDAEAGEEK